MRAILMLFLKVTLMSLWSLIGSVDFSIRLGDGITPYVGRLEIYYKGQWGLVCDDNWDKNDAKVVCRELGFGEPVRSHIIYLNRSNKPIYLDGEVRCTGLESRLSLCSHGAFGGHHDYCSNYFEVALECSQAYKDDFSLRLSYGVYPGDGRLEMSFQAEWSQICKNQWTKQNSDVACKQLGYLMSDAWVYKNYQFPTDRGQYLRKFDCDGHESKLIECRRSLMNEDDDCIEPVVLQCTNESEHYSLGEARLVGSDNDNEGVLEMYIYGTWARICSMYWTDAQSEVLCRQLGFDSFGEMQSAYSYRYASQDSPIVNVSSNCYGDVGSLSACGTSYKASCTSSVVALTCNKSSVYEDDFSLRLSYGVYPGDGRLEVSFQAEWSQICKNQWTKQNSDVACKQLGYLRSDAWVYKNYQFPTDRGQYLRTFDCEGHESKLIECRRSLVNEDDNCNEPVVLQCTHESEHHSLGEARLVGSDNDKEGVLEMYIYGTWARICSVYWTDAQSEVLCRQLGFDSFGEMQSAYSYSIYASQDSPIVSVSSNCYGDVDSLSACGTSYKSSCTSPVAVSCESSGLSGWVIAAIVVGCIVGLIFLYGCLCPSRKKSEPVSVTAVTDPPVQMINIPVDHDNGSPEILVVPSAPEVTDDLPPTYDSCVMQAPGMHKSTVTPPPAYEGCQPSFTQHWPTDSQDQHE